MSFLQEDGEGATPHALSSTDPVTFSSTPRLPQLILEMRSVLRGNGPREGLKTALKLEIAKFVLRLWIRKLTPCSIYVDDETFETAAAAQEESPGTCTGRLIAPAGQMLARAARYGSVRGCGV